MSLCQRARLRTSDEEATPQRPVGPRLGAAKRQRGVKEAPAEGGR